MTASIRFHGALRSLVSPRRRDAAPDAGPDAGATIKHLIEVLGVPHTEVGAVRVDGRDASLDEAPAGARRIEVFPWPPARLARTGAPQPDAAPPAFLADAHLGALARELRLLGFDTLLGRDASDSVLAALSRSDGRILLTRDRELLKHRIVGAGCFIVPLRLDEQLAQLDQRFGLRFAMRPFTRCLECNALLGAVPRAMIEDRLPPAVSARHSAFTLCRGCGRVYWRGSHWNKLNARIEAFRRRPGN